MTVASATSRVSYAGDGATVAFPVSFKFLANGDLKVLLVDATGVETAWTLGTQYTLTGAGVDSGGTLTVSTSPVDYTPADGTTLVIYRDPDITQGAALPLGGPFPSTTVERMADRLTMIAQRLNDLIARSIRQPDGDTDSIDPLPAAVARASMLAGFDAEGNLIAVDPAGLAATAAVVTAFMLTLLDDTTDAAARATLGLGTSDTPTLAGLTVRSDDDDNLLGPTVTTDRDSASPAPSDGLGAYLFQGRNDVGAEVVYARMIGEILGAGAGSEAGRGHLQAVTGGVISDALLWAEGIFAPGRADKGEGTINFDELYTDALYVSDVKVVGARATGWGAATGTATRTTFATGSVTTAQLAERVKALIDDLSSHGLIGA
jgi:hypothetical protein